MIDISHDQVGEYVTHIAEHCDDVKTDAAHFGIGWRSYFYDLFSTERDNGDIERYFVQIYAESQIDDNPKDQTAGYTPEDVDVNRGMLVVRVNHGRKCPEYMGWDKLDDDVLRECVVDTDVANVLGDVWKKLTPLVTPGAKWFSKVNSLYSQRNTTYDQNVIRGQIKH